jgi:Ca2+-binding EF-hand superfamily protein
VVGGGNDEALARMLAKRYGKAGELSPAELARFGDRPADVTLTVRLGDRAGLPLMTLGSDRPLPAGVRAKATREGVTLQLGTTRLDLVASPAAEVALPVNVRAQLRARFRQADSNGDGHLDRMEARRAGFFAALFDAMDRDGDGKVSEKEMLAYVDGVESLCKLAGRSCVSLAFTTEGKGLFDLLDRDGDGRLSVRELRDAPLLLPLLEGNRDGSLAARHLAAGQVPRRHRAALALGPSGGRGPFVGVAAFPPRGAEPSRRPAEARGPLWFRKMDRNRDGDVSRKEFVGTDEQFREIDTDGDGLISAEEAERYDRRKRAGKE